MLPTKFRFIWQSGFRGEEFKKSAIQTQDSPMVAMANMAATGDCCFRLADF
jgi:hypothetical protein